MIGMADLLMGFTRAITI